MYRVLHKLKILEYIYFLISKNIHSYVFLLVFKIVKSLQCFLKKLDKFGIKRRSSGILSGKNFAFEKQLFSILTNIKSNERI